MSTSIHSGDCQAIVSQADGGGRDDVVLQRVVLAAMAA
jgi:hypothetical protein